MTADERDARRTTAAGPPDEAEQAEPSASSDGDGSWTKDPQTQDPGEDRSVDAVIRRTSRDGS